MITKLLNLFRKDPSESYKRHLPPMIKEVSSIESIGMSFGDSPVEFVNRIDNTAQEFINFLKTQRLDYIRSVIIDYVMASVNYAIKYNTNNFIITRGAPITIDVNNIIRYHLCPANSATLLITMGTSKRSHFAWNGIDVDLLLKHLIANKQMLDLCSDVLCKLEFTDIYLVRERPGREYEYEFWMGSSESCKQYYKDKTDGSSTPSQSPDNPQ